MLSSAGDPDCGGVIMARNRELGWDLESLNKAYHQGYMAALIHMEPSRCPYHTEVVRAAWEAGWEDGAEAEGERRRPQAGIFIA